MLDQSQVDAAVPTISTQVNGLPSLPVTHSSIQSKLTLRLSESNAAPNLPDEAAKTGPARRWMRIVIGTAVSLLALTFILVAGARTPPETSTAEPTTAVGAAPSTTPANTLSSNTPVSTRVPTTAVTYRETPAPRQPISPQTSFIPPDAVVTSIMSLRLRSGPGQQFESLGSYEPGTALEVTGRNSAGTWLRVRMRNGRTGWMSKEYLQVNISLDNLPVEN
jgi:hypothetical protein